MFAALKRFTPLLILLGDLIALLLFVYIGQRDHGLVDAESPLQGLLWASWAFALAWVIAAALLRALPDAATLSARSLLANGLNAWLVAAPLGVLLRAYFLGRAVIPTSFLAATLAFGGLFVLGWRLVFVLLWKTTKQ